MEMPKRQAELAGTTAEEAGRVSEGHEKVRPVLGRSKIAAFQ